MNNDLFRKESLDNASGSENPSSYVKVLRPGIWLIGIGVLIALAGLVYFRLATDLLVMEMLFGDFSVGG